MVCIFNHLSIVVVSQCVVGLIIIIILIIVSAVCFLYVFGTN